MRLLILANALGAAVAAAGLDQSPLLPPGAGLVQHDQPTSEFRLAHIFHHGTSRFPRLHRRLDVGRSASVWMRGDDSDEVKASQSQPMPALHVRSKSISVQRLADRSNDYIDDLLAEARWFGRPPDLPASAWTTEDTPAPNVTDKETVLALARMAVDAYVEGPDAGEWEDLDSIYNRTLDFGWEKDGIRGHVYTDAKNSTVIIGLKGTTVAVYDGAGTTTQDKLNDNLFFGCCCGQGSWFASQACHCQTATYTCNTTCIQTTLRDKNHYYFAAQELYRNVTALYPDSHVWMVGHSLGGAMSGLVAATYGRPAVTFEAPGEAMAAQRLGLPTPPGYRTGNSDVSRSELPFYHFGHNADPLYTGECGSACYVAGYAMESMCHSGYECVYNTTGELQWGQSLTTHSIRYVLHNVLEYFNTTAKCSVNRDCTDCFQWKYFESNSSSGTSTSIQSSTSFTQTRTETCKSPGWWGCLDESTSQPTTTSTSSSSSTSTCKTPGWFGCKDPTTTTATTTSSSSVDQAQAYAAALASDASLPGWRDMPGARVRPSPASKATTARQTEAALK